MHRSTDSSNVATSARLTPSFAKSIASASDVSSVGTAVHHCPCGDRAVERR